MNEQNFSYTHPEVLQERLHDWRKKNFPDADIYQQFMGMVEELGELAHADLKKIQGIRGDDNLHDAEAQDAIGDLLIYLCGYCSFRGWSFWKILIQTSNEVLKRDWIANPHTGDVPLAE